MGCVMGGMVDRVRGIVMSREEVRPVKAVAVWVLPLSVTVGD